MATYRVRRNAFESESIFELTDAALTRSVDGREHERIALANVRRVLIIRGGAGGNYARYYPAWTCSVQSPGGRMAIPSSAFVGVSQTQDQHVAFRGFIQTLTRTIAAQPHAQPVAFVRRNWSRMIQTFLGIAWLLLIPSAIIAATTGIGVAWVALWAVADVVATAICAWMWSGNRSGGFDPNALPADIAPGG